MGINGTPVPLTVDSGAFFSVLTQAAATQLDLRTRQFPALRVEGIAGRMDARVTTVDKLQLAKGDISRVDFVVGGNEPGAGTIVSLGLDTFVDDPISKFGLLAGDFSKLGARLGQLNLPTVFILEGGYAVAELGINAASVLDAFDHE